MTCLEAAHGEEGIAVANAEVDRLDAIVLDVMMPGIDGYEVMRRIFKSPITKELPILLLTAHANTDDDVVQSMEIGALDHLSKPFSGPVLVAKVKAACTRRAKSRALVTELDLARENATIDALTGLANRRPFEQRLTEESAHARRHHRPFSLVMIDLDHFKLLNDSYGHETGDRALKHTARLIKAMLRTDDFAFRYGGEEFALLLRSCSANDAIKDRAAPDRAQELSSRRRGYGDAGDHLQRWGRVCRSRKRLPDRRPGLPRRRRALPIEARRPRPHVPRRVERRQSVSLWRGLRRRRASSGRRPQPDRRG
jgi:diguanylate cyclase (GGDEF)-like protein